MLRPFPPVFRRAFVRPAALARANLPDIGLNLEYLRWVVASAKRWRLLGFRMNPLFDPDWYAGRYPEVAAGNLDPHSHYRRHGAREGRWPNPFLDPAWYQRQYPGVRSTGIDPMDHYYLRGCWEGKDPGPNFDTRAYFAEYPELTRTRVNPLLHFMRSPAYRGNASVVERPHPGRKLITVRDEVEGASRLRQSIQIHASRSVAAGIDSIYWIPSWGVLVRGWLLDPAKRVHSAHAVADETTSPDFLSGAARHERPDLSDAYSEWNVGAASESAGFLAAIPLAGAPADVDGLRLTLEFRELGGERWWLTPRYIVYDDRGPIPSIRRILASLALVDGDSLANHVGPAIRALLAADSLEPAVAATTAFGRLPTRPDMAIVIPVGGRFELAEYQLSQLAQDPDVRDSELVLVVDDPEDTQDTTELALRLHRIYGIPMRVASSDRHLSLARALNLGIRASSSPMVMALGPAVVPLADGWLGRLSDSFRRTSLCGVLAPHLVRPDGSSYRHRSRFRRSQRYADVWMREYDTGRVPPPPGEVAGPERVMGVPALAMMLSREVMSRAKGFDESYLYEGYEDLDLSLRLRKLGYDTYVLDAVRVPCVDRPDTRFWDWGYVQQVNAYNAWRFTQAWGDVIADVAAPS